MQWMKNLVCVVVAAGLLSACNSDNDPEPVVTPPPVKQSSIKLVHAVSDAPAVSIDGGQLLQVAKLDYGQSTNLVSLPEGSYNLGVDALLPQNGKARVINAQGVMLSADNSYTVFATGSAAASSIAPVVVATPVATVASGNVRVRVVHAAASAPLVDIHVTAPGAALSSGTVAASLDFRQYTAPLTLTAGNYQVRITLPAKPDTVVFDSGSVALASGADLTIAAINNRFAGPSPVSLLAVNANGTYADIKDANSTADVRVVHAVSDAPAVDVLLNNSKAIPNLAFPDFTGYANLKPGSYNVKVAAAADNSVVVINADLDLAAGSFATVLATGSLGQGSITPLVLADNPRRIATEAQVRLVHASTLAGNVDIYVTASSDISSATPAFANVPFKAQTGYVSLLPGNYVVTVTPAGTKTAAIGPLALTLSGNKIYTAVARDSADRTAPLGLILLDDFN
ncbi:DUF4397 domain-containing protein [Rheinheimera sp.]|uniref:DUF4397 domain-containing protein n=1 Tax=Rheinheimera sp. TaxID=1869214 RepID=UPI0025FA152A|nr:DUF4397 domain-containing protein [Rheinheimera sp.]